MDSVCPSSVYTANTGPFAPAVGVFLNNAQSSLLRDLNTADPSLNDVPLFSTLTLNKPVITIAGSKTYTISPFAITSLVVQANSVTNRYAALTGSFNPPVAKLTNTQLTNTYALLTRTNVPGTNTRLMIIPAQTLINSKLSGNISDATESVSYDLLYSLQYEFCYYTKYFSILLGDYITVQNKPVDVNGFSQAKKNILLQKIINNLTITKGRLTDITDVAAFVGTTQTGELKGMSEKINQFVTTTQQSVEALNKNATILMSKDKESNLRSRQLEFSEEKNAYANQLLAMYGFANLIALGLLFYIYKS